MGSSYLDGVKALPKIAESLVASASDFLVNLYGNFKSETAGKQSTIIGLTLIFIGSQLYYWNKFSFWARQNVKTPRAIPVFGNFLSFLFHARQHIEVEWPKKYGKLYGFYLGTQPYLVCSDVEVFKMIAIKDFDKFKNHYFMGVRNKYQKNILLFLYDDHWRGMRSIVTPTFASGKIKVIYKSLNQCADDLVNECSKLMKDGESSADVELRSIFGSFAMASALRSFYGIQGIKGSSSEDDSIEGYARRSRAAFVPIPWRFIVCNILPDSWLEKLNFPLVADSRMEFFANKAKQIIRLRQKSGVKYNDYLQILLDAKADDANETIDNEIDMFEQHHTLIEGKTETNPSTWRQKKQRLTEDEVCCQVMMLMMVATETTATLLTHVTYLLANHQEVQQTLYEELCKIQPPNETLDFDYELLTTCQYLDSVIAEALRLMSPALAFDRVASEDYHIKKYNIHVPKGTVVNLAFYAIHRDPDYWPEPEKYDPTRFMPENKHKIVSGSYCPFGIGPRSCVGFRFALTETKVALAKLITRYRLEKAPGTVYPPVPKKITFVLNDNKDMRVLIKNRK